MHKIKILYLSHTSQIGGGEVALLTLIKYLDRKRFDPVMVFPSEGPLKEEAEGLEIKTCLSPLEWWIRDTRHFESVGGHLPENVHAFEKIIDRERPDIVHTNTSVASEGAIAARLKGVRHIWHIHEKIEGHPSLKAVLPFPIIYYVMELLSDRIAVDSNAVKDQLLASGLITPEKVLTIHNGIDIQRFKQSAPSTLRKELGLMDDVILAVTIGKVVREKGHEVLLEAAALVKKKDTNLKFIIVGGGDPEDVNSLLKKIEGRGLKDTIYYLGYRKSLEDIVSSSDFLILPSHTESFPLVPLEAMAAGRPSIVTDCGGLSEMIRNGENGFIVPVNDPESIARRALDLAKDRENIREMGGNAKRIFNEKFRAEAFAGRFGDLYEEIAGMERPSHASGKEKILLRSFLETYKTLTEDIVMLRSCEMREKELKSHLDAIQNSMNWRITAPLRRAYNVFNSLVEKFR